SMARAFRAISTAMVTTKARNPSPACGGSVGADTGEDIGPISDGAVTEARGLAKNSPFWRGLRRPVAAFRGGPAKNRLARRAGFVQATHRGVEGSALEAVRIAGLGGLGKQAHGLDKAIQLGLGLR